MNKTGEIQWQFDFKLPYYKQGITIEVKNGEGFYFSITSLSEGNFGVIDINSGSVKNNFKIGGVFPDIIDTSYSDSYC